MSLYSKVKQYLPDIKGVISDDESLLFNRKDYHFTQISPVNATLDNLGMSIGYPYRVLISFLDQFAANIEFDDFNVVLADPSLAVAAFYVWLRGGGNLTRGKVYAPKGIGKFPETSSMFAEFINNFSAQTYASPDAKIDESRKNLFTFVLGNTKAANQTIFAADRFSEAKKGILVLKDYSKINAFDEREYLEGKLIFPAVTFEGHAFALKL